MEDHVSLLVININFLPNWQGDVMDDILGWGVQECKREGGRNENEKYFKMSG